MVIKVVISYNTNNRHSASCIGKLFQTSVTLTVSQCTTRLFHSIYSKDTLPAVNAPSGHIFCPHKVRQLATPGSHGACYMRDLARVQQLKGTLIFSLSFFTDWPSSNRVTGYLFTSLSALCRSQSS